MAGHAVILIYLGVFFIPALVVKLKRADRAVFHAGTASQTFVLINHDVLAAGRTQIEKLGKAVILFLQLGKVRNRSEGIAAFGADFQCIFHLPVQNLTLGTFLLRAFRRTVRQRPQDRFS